MKETEDKLTSGIQALATEEGTITTENLAKEIGMSGIYNKVKYCLDKEKVFLNPKLSLAKFSIIVGTKTLHS